MNTATAFAASSTGDLSSVHTNVVEKSFSPLVQQFLQFLKLEKHFSDYTVKSYGADLFQFGQFLSGSIGQLPGASLGRQATGEEIDERQLKC
jgi:hypothetical protein